MCLTSNLFIEHTNPSQIQIIYTKKEKKKKWDILYVLKSKVLRFSVFCFRRCYM